MYPWACAKYKHVSKQFCMCNYIDTYIMESNFLFYYFILIQYGVLLVSEVEK